MESGLNNMGHSVHYGNHAIFLSIKRTALRLQPLHQT
jgi:hypothetical protein